MSELQSQFVKRGYWVNEARGQVMGQTITTDTRTGAIIIALLALLTSLGMSHLWHLITFSWHQARASGHDKDGLFRQQQALLRTFPSPSALVADSFKLWFAWRKLKVGAFKATAAQAVTALFFAVATIATSILSSYIAINSDVEVLVQSPHCAALNTTLSPENYIQIMEPLVDAYAVACYGNSSLPSQCDIFSRPNVAFSTQNTTCPFNQSICSSSAVAIDSGYVDVGQAFGLNIGSSDNLHYRKRSVCSMLSLDGRVSVVNASDIDPSLLGRKSLPGETLATYSFGGPVANGSTFGISLYGQLFSKSLVHGYITQFQRAEENNRRVASFVAIPELQVPNADVSVRLTRTNSMRFLTPVDDPMFAAHQETILRDAADRFNRTLYYSDNPGTMLGCTEQYQFCLGSDINNETCTELSGRNFDATTANFPKANSLQLAIISLLSTAATFSTVMPEPYRIESEGTSSAGMVNEVPDDQWIKEVEGWNAISWAGHQIVLAEYAVGQSVRDPTAPDYTRPPNSAGEKSLCRMQKMRKAGGFVNINVFGLVFIVTISCVVTIVDITLLRFISLLKKIKNFDSPRLERWMQDGLWQLQRHAYEAHGAGVWKDLTDEVPTIAEYTELPDLPLQHSSLSRVSTYNDSVGMKSPRVKQKDTFNEKSDTEIAVSPK